MREINSKYLKTLNRYGIPVKSVTVHDSDFVQQNGANTKTNNLKPNI
jgi:hypothetical protein